jgi:ATPase subunit of ABC transporter with duplicated ATPase domains
LPASLDSPAFSETDEADRALLTRASQAIEDLRGIAQEMEFLAAKCDEAFRQWTVDRDATAWKIAVDGSVAAYEELCQKLEHEGAGDPSAYRDLVNRRQEIEARLVDFQKRREDLKANQEETTASRAALVALRQELTRRREKFIADVLAGNVYVRIKVRAYGARDTVESEFRKLIQRETGGFEKDIGTVDGGDGLLSKLYAGNPDASEIEIRLGHIKDGLHNIAAGQSPATDMRDQRFGSHLSRLKPEVFDHLDAWFPEDTLQVEYSTGGDGTSFRSIQEGSPGQKTAALLAFLLSYGEEPIVLDQPEDDLDNQLIYSLIVKQLRMIKRKRQVIVVSHNANIVVNGDAELVLALAARGGETHIEAGGSLQEKVVRDTICTIMEGGREAFEQRYRRISL